jgi:hypothetical protein
MGRSEHGHRAPVAIGRPRGPGRYIGSLVAYLAPVHAYVRSSRRQQRHL